jgi:hypothetical protein
MDKEMLSDEVWEALVARGYIQDLNDDAIGEEKMVKVANALIFHDDLVEQGKAGVESEDGDWEVRPPRSDGYEADRTRTFADYLELEVAADLGVLKWRRSCWGSIRPAASDHAHGLVEDPEVRDIVSGLRAVEAEDVAPSGSLPFYSESGQIKHVDFYLGSNLEELWKHSEELRAKLFPRWTQAEAAWVIVTGKVREVPRCLVAEIEGRSNRHLTYGTINLTVEPWVTGDVVLQAYQHLQALALPRRPRALSARNLAMTRWVMERLHYILTAEVEDRVEPRDAAGKSRAALIQKSLNIFSQEPQDEAGSPRVSWRRLMAWWNQEHPQWAFQDERNFSRDCRRTIRAVAHPYDEKHLRDRFPDHPPKVSIP